MGQVDLHKYFRQNLIAMLIVNIDLQGRLVKVNYELLNVSVLIRKAMSQTFI